MKVSKLGFAVERLDLLDHFRLDLGRMAAGLQQRQHQRGEFVAHRDAGKFDARASSPGRPTANEGLREHRCRRTHADLVESAAMSLSSSHLPAPCRWRRAWRRVRSVAAATEVGLKLGLDGGVEHGFSPFKWMTCTAKAATDGTGGIGVSTPLQCTPGRSREPVQNSDLADQVQRRRQGGFAFLPLGRADFTRVAGDVLGGLDLAQQFQRRRGRCRRR
jgi:hypothetical protein